jgi:hypothetical protein
VVVRDFGRSAENTQEVALAGGSVWAVRDGKGKGSGVELTRPDALVASFRGGKAVKLGYYNDQTQALEAVGLGE